MTGLLTSCEHCGRDIRMALVIPSRIDPTVPRKHIPLDVEYDPATSPLRPSHGLSLSRTVCHPITEATPLQDHEIPALTHFATCPARRS